jgi:Tfp pilus assembly protein PilX
MKTLTQHHGLALPTLLALLTLASLATLLAMRNLWVNEQLLNAEADQLRTQHKAQAALPIAIQDIVQTATTINEAGEVTPNLRHTAGSEGQTHAFFPNTFAEYDTLRQRLGAETCRSGICAPNTLDSTSTQASYWKGQIHTAMPLSASETPYGADSTGYWVEVFPYADTQTFVYRITVSAYGMLPSSHTVLQTIWTRNTPTSTTGKWQSWHVLHD